MANFERKAQTLYRRDELFLRCGFDLDGSEKSINQNLMILNNFSSIVDERTNNMAAYPTPSVSSYKKTRLDDGSYYWSLYIDHGWLDLYIDPQYNPHCLCEISYDYCNPGSGQLDIWVNGMFAESRIGPSTWRTCPPHIAIDDIRLRCRQRNFGISDPPGRAELDNLLVYKYKELTTELFEYSPPKASSNPVSIETLRGHSYFQTTKAIGAEIGMTLRFFSASEHTDFITNVDKPHVFCDEKNTFYRGIIELQDCRKLGVDLYEQVILFKSPNKLGEGWK